MISRMLGAPFGGTMRGGHQTFEPLRVSLMTPPNFGSGTGSDFPPTVVVALGWPNTPVTCCAATGAVDAAKTTAANAVLPSPRFIRPAPFQVRTESWAPLGLPSGTRPVSGLSRTRTRRATAPWSSGHAPADGAMRDVFQMTTGRG